VAQLLLYFLLILVPFLIISRSFLGTTQPLALIIKNKARDFIPYNFLII